MQSRIYIRYIRYLCMYAVVRIPGRGSIFFLALLIVLYYSCTMSRMHVKWKSTGRPGSFKIYTVRTSIHEYSFLEVYRCSTRYIIGQGNRGFIRTSIWCLWSRSFNLLSDAPSAAEALYSCCTTSYCCTLSPSSPNSQQPVRQRELCELLLCDLLACCVVTTVNAGSVNSVNCCCVTCSLAVLWLLWMPWTSVKNEKYYSL